MSRPVGYFPESMHIALKIEAALAADTTLHFDKSSTTARADVTLSTSEKAKGCALATLLIPGYEARSMDRPVYVHVQDMQGKAYKPLAPSDPVALTRLCEAAFEGNPLFQRVKMDFVEGENRVFVIIKPTILQYMGDNINHPDGLVSFVASDVFSAIAEYNMQATYLSFCCDRII